jgi:hypothetical protein
MNSTAILSVRRWDTYRVLRLVVLAIGPFLTMAVARAATGTYGAGEQASVETIAMLLWSPLFFSIPALWLQNERDRALPSCSLLTRWLRLLPYLMTSPQSAIRPETVTSVASWAALTAVTWSSVVAVAGRILT